MRGMRRITTTMALLLAALLPVMASVTPDPPPAALDRTLPVAMAQPLASTDGAPLVAVPRTESWPTLPESGMLVLVGTTLIGLAALVRRTM
jgi:hypothetical protein